MKVIVERGIIGGEIFAPPSKSLTQRAYAAALLHKGTTVIHRAGTSDDERAALQIIQQLGARIVSQTEDRVEILSDGVVRAAGTIDCNESGLAARLFTPIAALANDRITIDGKGSLLNRQMPAVKEMLDELGVAMDDFNGHIPFSIKGPMHAKSIAVDASEGSQFLSGLLFALSHSAKEAITIDVANLKSRPYIDLTLEVLAEFGRPIRHEDYERFYIEPTLFRERETVEITVEGDWSGAAFFLVAGAIAGEVAVKGLDLNSRQADMKIIEALRDARAYMSIEDTRITVRSSALRAFDFDATHCPDLFPALAVLAACCDGDSSITGVHRLFNKESNRVESITEMLHSFGVHFSVGEDTLFVTGERRLQGTIIESYNDHRIVMAAAVGALRAKGPVEIDNPEAVNKSYPKFFKDLVFCGADCKFITT